MAALITRWNPHISRLMEYITFRPVYIALTMFQKGLYMRCCCLECLLAEKVLPICICFSFDFLAKALQIA